MLKTLFRRIRGRLSCHFSFAPRAPSNAMRSFRTARPAAAVAFGALALAAALAACSPTYDWRVVTNSAGGYVVDLPAKPGADERSIDIGGMTVRMRIQTAEAGDAVFVVGTVELPDDRPDTQQKALAFLRDGLARNVGASPDAREVEIPLASGGAVEGVEMRVTGKAAGERQTRTIHARLVAKGTRAYQVAIVGDHEPPPDQVDQFFGSFELL